ncbi:hypothetical protein TNIN_60161 [Trichonephila inaurata madagascariensis]|uniref:Uncharacterized protein n=1 Tax=Trichonephila inaurata madagascariensis TaxID=2747483 RepID=A0A8X6X4A7_9ARAC|nr:hypothetical protein TNIN_60161 [Trichonephila inaurata madagascariensis]
MIGTGSITPITGTVPFLFAVIALGSLAAKGGGRERKVFEHLVRNESHDEKIMPLPSLSPARNAPAQALKAQRENGSNY